MCGLIAFCGLEGGIPDLSAGLAAIRHRGPDGSGLFVSSSRDCALGHVRLAIIDLSESGHQPMSSADGRYVITYNGEVYNFRELKSDLEARHGPIEWRSSSDTEVVLRGFALEGVRFLSMLNGIFALAIYDTRLRELHVLRDPLGIKPLFVTETPAGVAFCSEMKGLLRVAGVDSRLREMAVAEQLAFMYIPEANTPYATIRKVAPGELQTWSRGKLLRAQPLFEALLKPLPDRSDQEWIESFRHAFSSAVRRQLVSDAPVSLMLSGGLDSSAVAWEAVNAGASFKTAYTIAYSQDDLRLDQQSDDLSFARQVAGDLGLKLEVIPAERALLGMLPGIAPYLEDGIADPAALNTYLICKAARESGVKVMLTGQGADEYLAGYRRHRAYDLLAHMPVWQRVPLRAASRLIPQNVPGRFNSLARRVRRLGALVGQKPEDRLTSLFTWMDGGAVGELLARPPAQSVGAGIAETFRRNRHLGELEALLRVDQEYDLRSLNLAYCDRLSMAAGVEARVPFLDFELVRLMNSLPSRMKLRGSQGKYVLKKAMEGRLPDSVIYREKAGFGLPLRAWLRQDSALVERCLGEERVRREGILSARAVSRLREEQFRGEADHANVLFALICFQLWMESISGAGRI